MLRPTLCTAAVVVAALLAPPSSADICPCPPSSGSCAEPHATPGCSDAACCEAVCAILCACCSLAWDETCVDAAIDTCGIFVYQCLPIPGQPPNDCFANAIAVAAPSSTPYNSTIANTDGPDQIACGSGFGDVPIWKDLWYYWIAGADGLLTASNCASAQYDSKIAIYDLGGDLPSEIDPDTLPGRFAGCNEDCESSRYFASELTVNVVAGRVYLIRVGGFLMDGGPGVLVVTATVNPPPYVCTDGGPEEFTHSNSPIATQSEVACAVDNVSTANQFARSFVNGGEPFLLECVDFGVFNDGSPLVGAFNVYVDVNGGAPKAPGIDLVLLDSRPVTLPHVAGKSDSDCCHANTVGGCSDPACEAAVCAGDDFCCEVAWDVVCAGQALDLCPELCGPPALANLTVAFSPPVTVAPGSTFVVELDVPASADGFAGCAGNAAGQTAPTYFRSEPCNFDTYVTFAAIGFPDSNWALTVSGEHVGTPCPWDFNGDDVVDGADLGSLLAQWENPYTGGDLGLLLGAWGPCP